MAVVLETERLFLRELLLNDIEPLAAISKSPEVTRHVGGPLDEAALRRWVQAQQASYREHGYGHWAVIHRESATLVGHAGLEGSPAKLGCVLDEPYWRHGLATEILTAVRDHAFGPLGLRALTATVAPKHKAGHALADALGMRVDAERPERPDKEDTIYVIEREGS